MALQKKVFSKFAVVIFMLFTVSSSTLASTSNISKGHHFILVAFKNAAQLDDAIRLADENHLKFIKPVTGFKNVYLFEVIPSVGRTEKRARFESTPILEKDERILWAAQQRPLKRDKRDLLLLPLDNWIDEPVGGETETLLDEFRKNFIWNPPPLFNDELWSEQWYMQNLYNTSGNEKLDLNVLPVYAKGITGNGIRVAVLDDGLEYNHEDLIQNYDPEISWDCNNDSPDPRPNYQSASNRHGTRCAGEIAMTANNRKCGVGIAFNVRIGGIKLLGGEVFDLVEGMALGFAHDKIDIYSSSWGPSDDGKTLERPGPFAQMALKRGINEGRKGLGAIYVWASGNGGSRKDNCNCDGYAASRYTITIGSVSRRGDLPWYSEKCSSILAVTYSSGTERDPMIATTDLKNKCTVQHTGTSASAPLAAGIIALALEANPALNWRDIQHIIVNTAEYQALRNNPDWIVNGAGRHYNIRFGFGLMDANSIVEAALAWKSIPKEISMKIAGIYLNDTAKKHLTMKTTNSATIIFNNLSSQLRYLEHVELLTNIRNRIRGNLEIFLTSPSNTRIPFMERRPKDRSDVGFINWTFMSVAFWAENPLGTWILDVVERFSNDSDIVVGNCTLILHGTFVKPMMINI